MKSSATYYLIWHSVVGKQESGRYYIFRNGQWEPDENSIIMDRLVGYDPSEPPGLHMGLETALSWSKWMRSLKKKL